jgi:hypothetical protein
LEGKKGQGEVQKRRKGKILEHEVSIPCSVETLSGAKTFSGLVVHAKVGHVPVNSDEIDGGEEDESNQGKKRVTFG